jgi:hypothetical protein
MAGDGKQPEQRTWRDRRTEVKETAATIAAVGAAATVIWIVVGYVWQSVFPYLSALTVLPVLATTIGATWSLRRTSSITIGAIYPFFPLTLLVIAMLEIGFTAGSWSAGTKDRTYLTLQGVMSFTSLWPALIFCTRCYEGWVR